LKNNLAFGAPLLLIWRVAERRGREERGGKRGRWNGERGRGNHRPKEVVEVLLLLMIVIWYLGKRDERWGGQWYGDNFVGKVLGEFSEKKSPKWYCKFFLP
jgi:hypothetical protein